MQRRGGTIWRNVRAAMPAPTGRRGFLRLGVASAPAVLAGCSGLRVVDALAPSGGYAVRPAIQYGPDPRQAMDAYLPARPGGGEPPPVVLFLYGGSWRSGERRDYRFVGSWLARTGHVALVADYRLHPAVCFPAFVEDAAAAFDVARREAEALGGDARRVVVMGHSAGAHMAALLALEPRYLGALGRTPAEIAGVVGISGPYVHDFGKVRWLAPVFPDEASRREAMVIAKARPGSPPMFLANGTADVLVPPRNATELAGRLGALGARVELRLYEQAGHADILLGLVDPLAGSSTLAMDVAAFLRSLAPV